MDHVNVTGDIPEATVNTVLGACLTGILRVRKLKTKLWKLKTNKGINKKIIKEWVHNIGNLQIVQILGQKEIILF